MHFCTHFWFFAVLQKFLSLTLAVKKFLQPRQVNKKLPQNLKILSHVQKCILYNWPQFKCFNNIFTFNCHGTGIEPPHPFFNKNKFLPKILELLRFQGATCYCMFLANILWSFNCIMNLVQHHIQSRNGLILFYIRLPCSLFQMLIQKQFFSVLTLLVY